MDRSKYHSEIYIDCREECSIALFCFETLRWRLVKYRNTANKLVDKIDPYCHTINIKYANFEIYLAAVSLIFEQMSVNQQLDCPSSWSPIVKLHHGRLAANSFTFQDLNLSWTGFHCACKSLIPWKINYAIDSFIAVLVFKNSYPDNFSISVI